MALIKSSTFSQVIRENVIEKAKEQREDELLDDQNYSIVIVSLMLLLLFSGLCTLLLSFQPFLWVRNLTIDILFGAKKASERRKKSDWQVTHANNRRASQRKSRYIINKVFRVIYEL